MKVKVEVHVKGKAKAKSKVQSGGIAISMKSNRPNNSLFRNSKLGISQNISRTKTRSYARNKPVSSTILNSLKKLEYRGYDSAGLATLTNKNINEKKCIGRVEELEKILFKTPSDGNIGIGHVRWATHGVPNIVNAHPHSTDQVSVVHNGIIENSDELKKELENKGLKFKSQTDTEVITLLISEALKEYDPLNSVFKTLKKLKGSFALGIIFKNFSILPIIISFLSGLSNEDLRLTDLIFTINTNNNSNSLNLSHAVVSVFLLFKFSKLKNEAFLHDFFSY